MPNGEHIVLIHVEGGSGKKQNTTAEEIYVCPLELRVRQGQMVRWLYNDLGRFECAFESASPFGEESKIIVGIDGSTKACLVTASKGRFSYTVMEGQLRKDPIIIVDPSNPK